MSEPEPTSPQSFLQLVETCDNFGIPASGARHILSEELASWHLSPDPTSPVLGLIRPEVLEQLKHEPTHHWSFWHHDDVARVSFTSSINTPAKRSAVMKELCERWSVEGHWAPQIGPTKWRGELYPIYRNPFGKLDAPPDSIDESSLDEDTLNYAFKMERSACALFGVVTFGVHMTVYQDSPEDHSCRIWVPKRARTKQTWPGYLDNSVAGGIPSGLGVYESLVKEAMEEASIEEDIVRKYTRAVGAVSYFYRTSAGWLQPEVEYIYDLCIPADVPLELKPLDGEVESFECLPLPEVVEKMRAGLFKANCAVVLIDFMIRHGYITPDNEPDFLEIITRLHGRFDYERW
ncbi:NUDIX hydrolase domain-like protein [Abortiporus biennis]|nr:NUDIX hydrolase domain-like protein [Abortiporus biennis]